MPCYDGRDSSQIETIYVDRNEGVVRSQRKDIKELKTRNDKLAALLCEAISIIDNEGASSKFSEDLATWSNLHTLFDENRLDLFTSLGKRADLRNGDEVQITAVSLTGVTVGANDVDTHSLNGRSLQESSLDIIDVEE